MKGLTRRLSFFFSPALRPREHRCEAFLHSLLQYVVSPNPALFSPTSFLLKHVRRDLNATNQAKKKTGLRCCPLPDESTSRQTLSRPLQGPVPSRWFSRDALMPEKEAFLWDLSLFLTPFFLVALVLQSRTGFPRSPTDDIRSFLRSSRSFSFLLVMCLLA